MKETNESNSRPIPGAYPLDNLGRIMSNDDSESNYQSNARENLPEARRIEPSTCYATNIIPVQEAEEVHQRDVEEQEKRIERIESERKRHQKEKKRRRTIGLVLLIFLMIAMGCLIYYFTKPPQPTSQPTTQPATQPTTTTQPKTMIDFCKALCEGANKLSVTDSTLIPMIKNAIDLDVSIQCWDLTEVTSLS